MLFKLLYDEKDSRKKRRVITLTRHFLQLFMMMITIVVIMVIT